jgi:hypothetical protein
MQKEVNRFVRVGMPIQLAKQIMENNNFSCTDYKNNVFSVEEEQTTTSKQTIVRGDYLNCIIEKSYFLASQNWQVFLLYKNNKVTMIHAVVNWQNL